MKKIFSKKFLITFCTIFVAFSVVIISLFCVNGANVRNSMYYLGGVRMVGYEAWFEFHDLEEELPEDLEIVVKAHVCEYEDSTLINEFDTEIVFTEFEDVGDEKSYRAVKMFAVLTSSTYEFSVTNVRYTKNGHSYMTMKKVDIWTADLDELEDRHESRKAWQIVWLVVMIVGYLALGLTILIYATNKHAKLNPRPLGAGGNKFICRYCGAVNSNTDKKCSGCGAPLK